ncbi:MAG: c-type cytochrome [Bradyrhizobium sp.]|jgi:mono/diheme cytochrome c family protein
MMLLRSVLLMLILSAALGSAAQAETPNGNLAAAGRDFAQRVCGACHVVTPQREPVLSPPAPSFVVLAQRPLLTEPALREFLASNHGTMGPHEAMPNPRLVDYQIDEIVAFMMSLKAGK